MPERELSKTEAAKLIGITVEAVRHAIKKGYLKTVQRGPFQLVLQHSAEAYRDNRPKPGLETGRKLGPRKKKS